MGTSDRKPRVLFVDDESAVLQSMRTSLRKQRSKWDLVFAEGADAALEAMDERPVDVVVSDMRMPSIDGAELLKRVSTNWPATVRIVLTGEAERSLVTRALPVAQQWLNKPCGRDALVRCIDRALAARRFLDLPELARVLESDRELPSLPRNFELLNQLLQSPDSSAERVAEVLGRDAAMAAKVLQFANSAMFGRHDDVVSLQDAVSLVGLRSLRYLVLAAGVFGALRDDPASARVEAATLDAIESKSVCMSRVAGSLPADPDVALVAATAGLLHGVGHLVLATWDSAEWRRVAEESATTGASISAVERRVFGVGHEEVAAGLFAAWGLPNDLVLATALHHSPRDWPDDQVDVAAALLVAETLVSDPEAVDRLGEALAPFDFTERLENWLDVGRRVMETEA